MSSRCASTLGGLACLVSLALVLCVSCAAPLEYKPFGASPSNTFGEQRSGYREVYLGGGRFLVTYVGDFESDGPEVCARLRDRRIAELAELYGYTDREVLSQAEFEAYSPVNDFGPPTAWARVQYEGEPVRNDFHFGAKRLALQLVPNADTTLRVLDGPLIRVRAPRFLAPGDRVTVGGGELDAFTYTRAWLRVAGDQPRVQEVYPGSVVFVTTDGFWVLAGELGEARDVHAFVR